MFEKLDSCPFLSLAFPHRLSPNAFCLAVFIKEYHENELHRGAFEYDSNGMVLFMAIFNISKPMYDMAFQELVDKSILVDDGELKYGIDCNNFS